MCAQRAQQAASRAAVEKLHADVATADGKLSVAQGALQSQAAATAAADRAATQSVLSGLKAAAAAARADQASVRASGVATRQVIEDATRKLERSKERVDAVSLKDLQINVPQVLLAIAVRSLTGLMAQTASTAKGIGRR